MDRGAWRAQVHRVAELAMTETILHMITGDTKHISSIITSSVAEDLQPTLEKLQTILDLSTYRTAFRLEELFN